MAWVYRYTDTADDIIKYVGIVWSKNRTLEQRVHEHASEKKFVGHRWKIEYKEVDDMTRTDAEYMEAHYISLYETYKYLNRAKSNWGVSSFITDDQNDWKEFIPKPSPKSVYKSSKHVTYTIRLDHDSIQNAIKSIEDYAIKIYS